MVVIWQADVNIFKHPAPLGSRWSFRKALLLYFVMPSFNVVIKADHVHL